MDAKNIPPAVLVSSFLKAAREARVEATVVYFTPENNAMGAAEIATNRGQAAADRAMSILDKHGVKKAAEVLHRVCGAYDEGPRMRCSRPNAPWNELSAELQADHVAAAWVVSRALAAGSIVPDDDSAGNPPSGLIV